ncbi:MAG: hypothetical protein IT237_05620 [Bacteroidia bacterium]|nr:hypothetical protein [Bacteroidia bacterium]
MLKKLTFILFLVTSFTIHAQVKDTIVLMNGNYATGKVIDTLIGAVTIIDSTAKTKKLHYEYDEIYCVKFNDGYKKYYYRQDSLINNWFTRDEMQYYIYGERDARKGFKARGALIGAGVAGLLAGATGSFFAPVLPYGYMALTGLPKVRIRHKTISNPNYIDYDAYILGYERVSRSRRRIQALIGGTIGLAAGYGLYFGLLKDKLPATITLRF